MGPQLKWMDAEGNGCYPRSSCTSRSSAVSSTRFLMPASSGRYLPAHSHAMRIRTLISALGLPVLAFTQAVTNITCAPFQAEQVIKGLYDPASYAASVPISDHATIICELRTAISADSLRSHLETLTTFHTRHSFSDTLSPDTGIGAARRWAFGKFQEFSAANEGRLIPGYLSFDYLGDPCGTDGYGWRNVHAVLPGADPLNNGSLVIIEAHLDSRCADACDATCLAHGADDNGSGSALVLELARVLSRYTFDHTIVFILTTGEEQGLVGATAMAKWCVDNAVPIKGVQNNDIVGGIWCGETSSEPGCPAVGHVDSLQVRLFSNGSIPRPYRGFARSIKLWYEEKLRENVPVPMTISIMNVEDRADRGGDHIPFRERFFRNVRFTSANEHGNANTLDPEYHDRQHTSGDVLGVDTDDDLAIDSFFVDFNYLARNTVINGMTAALLASGPEPPVFEVLDQPDGVRVSISPLPDAVAYRIGVRTTSDNRDFDALYRTTDTLFLVPGQVTGEQYWVSVASIDGEGITSPFSKEVVRTSDAETPPSPVDDLPYGLPCEPIPVPELGPVKGNAMVLSCSPNPFGTSTMITVDVPATEGIQSAELIVRNGLGSTIERIPVRLSPGQNTVTYTHRGSAGLFLVALESRAGQVGWGRMLVMR